MIWDDRLQQPSSCQELYKTTAFVSGRRLTENALTTKFFYYTNDAILLFRCIKIWNVRKRRGFFRYALHHTMCQINIQIAI